MNFEHKTTKILLITVIILLGLFILFMTFYFSKTKTLIVPENPLFLNENLSAEARIENLLSYMTLEEKVGQMALVEKNSLKDDQDILKYGLGGILSGAGSKADINTADGWKMMIDNYQSIANESRLKIPLLYGVDAVHGHGHVPGATIFPHAIGLGATGDAKLVERIAEATAEELTATGVNWNYAPNLDLPSDIRWGRTYEAFSDDSELVSEMSSAYVRGFQNSNNTKVLATLKHFVGLGDMVWNTSKNKNFKIDQGVTKANDDLLRSVYLPPFKASIDAGAMSLMVGLNDWGNSNSVITSKYLLTDVLKKELNFKGFIVSDWYGIYENRSNKFLAMVEAVNAGTDMVMLPFNYKKFTRDMVWANRLGLISDERIDDAVRRILRAKFFIGLFDESKNLKKSTNILGSAEYRNLAREAVASSLVLLKNVNNILPIKNSVKNIYVAGSAASNTGRQSGAWTVEWQGIDGDLPVNADSILKGIQEQAGEDTVVSYDENAKFENLKKAEIGIAIVGESPYAEGWGDKEYPIIDPSDLETISRLQKSSEKIIVIIVSGRPLLISKEIDSWNAVVAAWLPGSEGLGVADVLFGDKQFKGKLPVPWPRTSEQLPISSTGKTSNNTEVLFPRYFGL